MTPRKTIRVPEISRKQFERVLSGTIGNGPALYRREQVEG